MKNFGKSNISKKIYKENVMELAIAIFLGVFLAVVGVIGYSRISKDFKENDK